MKIYNEIILQWDENTNQFDTIYEDSFEYGGEVALAARKRGGGGGYGKGGGKGSGGAGKGGGAGGAKKPQKPPVISAKKMQPKITVDGQFDLGDTITLSAIESTPMLKQWPITGWEWKQLSGPSVQMPITNTETISVIIPYGDYSGDEELVFELTVTDDYGHSATINTQKSVDTSDDIFLSGNTIVFGTYGGTTDPMFYTKIVPKDNEKIIGHTFTNELQIQIPNNYDGVGTYSKLYYLRKLNIDGTIADDFYTTDIKEKEDSLEIGYELMDSIGYIIDSPLSGTTSLEPVYDWIERQREIISSTDPEASPIVFQELFDEWDDIYAPNSYWWRGNLGNVLQIDGPKGVGDGAIRLYRKTQHSIETSTGVHAGALYNYSGITWDGDSAEAYDMEKSFGITERTPQHLLLKENTEYKLTVWGRANTYDKMAKIWIGDSRSSEPVGLFNNPNDVLNMTTSWGKVHYWKTVTPPLDEEIQEVDWVKTSFNFVPKKNDIKKDDLTIGGSVFKVKFWSYAGGEKPAWESKNSGDNAPALAQDHESIWFDWGTSAGPLGTVGLFMMEATGWWNPPRTGNYFFRAWVDDGVRLWVDDKIVLDKWVSGAAVNRDSRVISMTRNTPVKLKLRYYDGGGAGRIKLSVKDLESFTFERAYASPSTHFPKYPGVMANIWLYASTFKGDNTSYTDFANLKIEELRPVPSDYQPEESGELYEEPQ